MLRLIGRAGLSTVFLAIAGSFLSPQSKTHVGSLELTHGKPFVTVMVNGKGPFRFIIDTGTSAQAFVAPELAQQLHLPFVGKESLTDPSRRGRQAVRVVLVDSLQVAGVGFTSVKAVVHTLGDGDGYYEGLLGFALFRDYLLTLDFPSRSISIEPGELKPDGGQSVLPFRMSNGLPVISLQIGSMHMDAQVDSGGQGLSLPQDEAIHLKFLSDPEPLGNEHSLSTKFKIWTARLASDVRLGAYTFMMPDVEINAAFPIANFGSIPMDDFSITFDQANALVQFESGKMKHRISTAQTPRCLLNMPRPSQPDLALLPID